MKVFDEWYKKNHDESTSPLQFTKLTSDDIAIQEDIYIDLLLVDKFGMPPGNCGQLYYDHAIKELQKANDLFLETFGQ